MLPSGLTRRSPIPGTIQTPNENGEDRARLPSGQKLACDLILPRTDRTIACLGLGPATETLSFQAMSKTIHAVFENGIFRPVEPVDLPDNVEVVLEPRVVEENEGCADGYFETTAGALAQEPFDRPDQGALPNRGKW